MEPAPGPAAGSEAWRGPVRAEQTRGQVDALRAEIDAWLAGWRAADERRQYHTQLTTLEHILTEALTGLRAQADTLALRGTTGEVYSACVATEQRLLWVRRVLWGYFQEKFDQRRAAPVTVGAGAEAYVLNPARVLRAADEVVWSCYAEAMDTARTYDPTVARGTTPLPYLEARFSPQAIPRTDPPGLLRDRSIGAFARKYLAELPIPVISLPPWCVREPWALAFLAHEVGHHVQHDLRPDYGLIDAFGKQVWQAAEEAAGRALSRDEKTRWYAWGQEVFADLFSVVMLGGSAARAMVELETVPAGFGHEHRDLYPSPLARLALLRGAVAALEPTDSVTPPLPEPHVPPGLPTAEAVEAELRQAAAVGAALVEAPLAGLASLTILGRWRAEDVSATGAVGIWTRVLRDTRPVLRKNTRAAARQLVSAAVVHWAWLVQTYGEQLAADDAGMDDEGAGDAGADDVTWQHLRSRQVHLTQRLFEAIEANQEPGTRAATAAPRAALTPIAEEMTNTLLEVDPFED